MTPLYPVFLRLAERRCTVVGGGQVATRKVLALLECGAQVTVIAPWASSAIRQLAAEGRLTWLVRAYQPGDLADAWLAIAATDAAAVNATVVEEAHARGVLVGAVEGDLGADFANAAVARRGDVALAISTAGRSPAFARWLREQVERLLDTHLPLFDLLAELRPEALGSDGAAWQAALDAEVREALAAGDRAGAKALLAQRLGLAAPAEPASEAAPVR